MQKRHTSTRDITAGDILWLSSWPAERYGDLSYAKPKSDIFGHPIMIWSLNMIEQEACVLVVRVFSSP